jgi:hypothetical protein
LHKKSSLAPHETTNRGTLGNAPSLNTADHKEQAYASKVTLSLMAKKQVLGFNLAPRLNKSTTNISSECWTASIGPDHPKPDGIFGNDRLQLKRPSCSFLDLLVPEPSRLVSHRCST